MSKQHTGYVPNNKYLVSPAGVVLDWNDILERDARFILCVADKDGTLIVTDKIVAEPTKLNNAELIGDFNQDGKVHGGPGTVAPPAIESGVVDAVRSEIIDAQVEETVTKLEGKHRPRRVPAVLPTE